MSAYRDYHSRLLSCFDAYRAAAALPASVFDSAYNKPRNPPVFRREYASLNVLAEPGIDSAQLEALFALCPPGERHRWFRSMSSSQALTLSVLGNLAASGHLWLLADLSADSGLPAFGPAVISPETFTLEHRVSHLGERRSSSLDGFVSGDYQVAIECKFTEREMGTCSRPRLRSGDSNFEQDFCDGTYTRQRGRQHRCSLAENGVRYWDYVPALFTWQTGSDLIPCPLNRNYQLVRNVLAAAVRPDAAVSASYGHALVIYDARNPAFRSGGVARQAVVEVQQAAKAPGLLRTLSWQAITARMRRKNVLPWLAAALAEKYGL